MSEPSFDNIACRPALIWMNSTFQELYRFFMDNQYHRLTANKLDNQTTAGITVRAYYKGLQV